MTKSGRVLSGKPVVFSIPIDFCIEFWNSTFSPVLEFTEGIFLTASARAFQWCKPRMRSCFRSKVIQVFLAANSTWTYYSMCVCVYTVVILVRVHTVVILVRVHSGITSMCVYTVVILVRVHSDIISACTQW